MFFKILFMHLFALSFSINIDSVLNFSEKKPEKIKNKNVTPDSQTTLSNEDRL